MGLEILTTAVAKFCAMIEVDLDPRGRNAQTLSGLEGSSNTGCLQQAWNPGLNNICPQLDCPPLHIGKPYSNTTVDRPMRAVILKTQIARTTFITTSRI